MAIAGLVLGIISLVASLFPICGFPLAIGGVVFSVLGLKSRAHRTMAIVGLVLAILGFIFTLASAAYGAYLGMHAAAR
jgi:hypothetical protein